MRNCVKTWPSGCTSRSVQVCPGRRPQNHAIPAVMISLGIPNREVCVSLYKGTEKKKIPHLLLSWWQLSSKPGLVVCVKPHNNSEKARKTCYWDTTETVATINNGLRDITTQSQEVDREWLTTSVALFISPLCVLLYFDIGSVESPLTLTSSKMNR